MTGTRVSQLKTLPQEKALGRKKPTLLWVSAGRLPQASGFIAQIVWVFKTSTVTPILRTP